MNIDFMHMAKPLVLVALVAGCSAEVSQGIDHIATTYPANIAKRHELNGEIWKVLDRPDINKMVIRPNLSKAYSEGRKQAKSDSPQKIFVTDEEFRPAAALYLENKGCKITDGRLIIDGNFEYDYTC